VRIRLLLKPGQSLAARTPSAADAAGSASKAVIGPTPQGRYSTKRSVSDDQAAIIVVA